MRKLSSAPGGRGAGGCSALAANEPPHYSPECLPRPPSISICLAGSGDFYAAGWPAGLIVSSQGPHFHTSHLISGFESRLARRFYKMTDMTRPGFFFSRFPLPLCPQAPFPGKPS